MPDIEKYVGETFNSTLPTTEMVTIPEEYASALQNSKRRSSNRSHSSRRYR